MASQDVIGPNPLRIIGVRQWTEDGGEEEVVTFDGTFAAIREQFDIERANPSQPWTSIAESIDRTGGTGTLVLTELPRENTLNEVEGLIRVRFELDRAVIRRNLRTHRKISGIENLGDSEQSVKEQTDILDKLDIIIRRGKPKSDPDWTTSEFLPATSNTRRYFYLRKHGTNVYQTSTYVLRRIETVSDIFSVDEDQLTVNTVTDLPSGIPQIMQSVIESLDIDWLKQPVDIKALGENKSDIVQEWWGGDPFWSTLLYLGRYDPTPPGVIE